MMEQQANSRDATSMSRSVAELLQETASHTENVVRGEIRLAVLRVQEKLALQARHVVLLAVSGVLGVLAVTLLLVAAVLLLHRWLDAWVATAIVGLSTAAAAVILGARSDRSHERSS